MQNKRIEDLESLENKAKEIEETIKTAVFRMKRTKKNIKACKETCKHTTEIISKINGAKCQK